MTKSFGVTSQLLLATIALISLSISSSSTSSISLVSAAAPPPLKGGPTSAHATTAAAPTTSSAGTPAPTLKVPSGVFGVASATSNDAIYYHGGQTPQATTSGELFSLDMTKPWNVSFPAWTNLTVPSSGAGGPTVAGHSAALSQDQSTLYLTAPTGSSANPFLYEYNTKSRTWSNVNAPAAQAAAWTSRKKAQLVTDPNSGALWYIGGVLASGADTNELDQFKSGTWNANVTTLLGSFSSGTAQLVGTRIYLFGGFGSTTGQRTYQSFQSLPYIDISTTPPTVGTQLTLGAVPPQRQDHCSVLTSSQKVVIFGGYDANSNSAFSDVWSLDMVTMTWQQIVTINQAKPRYSHTCNLVGANMVIFGGMASSNIGYVGDVQVYDVMQSTWMSFYAPKQDTTPPSKPAPGGFGSGSGGSGLGTGALIGIIIGVFAVIGLVLGSVFYKKRQKTIEIREAELEKEAYLASLGSDDPGTDANRRKQPNRGKNPYGAIASPHSASTRHLNDSGYTAPNTPGVAHYALDSPALGGDLAMDGVDSPNIQYLMQQLPDGTIAVQPVYLDHQPQTPRSNFYSPRVRDQQDQDQGYFAPPPPIHNNAAARSGYGQPIQSNPPSPSVRSYNSAPGTPSLSHSYVMPPPAAPPTPTVPTQWQNIPLPPPSSHDPFGSPVPSSYT
ncbi:hypothetical protein BGZ83_012123, partial [Gryganskiella cystojenkinii]